MTSGGYIKLWRGWRDCPELDTATHRDAWIWMLERACWKPTRFKVGAQFVMLERGQLCVSVRQIATAVGCSKSAADRFLTRLEIGTMIERQAGQFKNVITICNYGKYQDEPEGARDKSGTVAGTRAGQERDTKEEGKKVKKEEYPPLIPPEGVSESVFLEFVDYRKNKIKKPLTQRALDGLVREAKRAGWTVEAAMVKAMEKDWRTFDADYVKGKDNGNGFRNGSGASPDKRSGLAKAIDSELERVSAFP